jgi:thiopeptide-type bacteriocin biosynthesis protein
MNLFWLSIKKRQHQSCSKMEKRIFIPGSEWVYFKIYTGTKTADAILKNEIYRYVREMLDRSVIDKWFFIRYNDPDFHIRLRLHLKETQDFSYIFSRFFEIFYPFVDTGLVWNVQCDTYKREMERYGVNTILLVEDLFFIDSEFIVKLLHQLNAENPEQHRWKLALVLIDSFLSAFSFDLSQQKELLNTMANNFKKEFGFTHHNVTKQLNDKYRFYRKEIESAMLWESEFSETSELINARRQVICPIAAKITGIEQLGELQISLQSLLTSLIHMTMNRWFRTENRLHEMVIYEFLSRHYASVIAKNNRNYT